MSEFLRHAAAARAEETLSSRPSQRCDDVAIIDDDELDQAVCMEAIDQLSSRL